MNCTQAILLAIVIGIGIYVSDEEAPVDSCQKVKNDY